jgi:hypothetical protein
MPNDRRCGIPAKTLPPCDLEWGHDGDCHSNAGDGFYARDYEVEHHRRQKEKRRKEKRRKEKRRTVLGRDGV